jgi:hypothetical protein
MPSLAIDPANHTSKSRIGSKFDGKELQADPTRRRIKKQDHKVLIHLNSYKINPTYNTDGLINCLPQPGQLRNQLHKSM